MYQIHSIFTKTLKNYTKVFKYIWNEMKLDIELDSDIEKTKEIIYMIYYIIMKY